MYKIDNLLTILLFPIRYMIQAAIAVLLFLPYK